MAQDPIRELTIRERELLPRVIEAIRTNSVRIHSQLVNKHLRGQTTDTTLRRRTGTLARSVAVLIPKVEGSIVRGGISTGTRYAPVHIGPRGSQFIIRPTKAQYLAIPLPAAQTAAGVARGGPRSGIFGKTFIAKSKAGNLIIFGTSSGVKKGAGAVRPLFVLKKSVVIPRRPDPDKDLLEWVKPKFMQDLAKAVMKNG